MKRAFPIWLLFLVALVAPAAAQSLDLTRARVPGGGGVSAGGQFTLFSTVAQPESAARAAGGAFTLDSGFLGATIPSPIPTVFFPLGTVTVLEDSGAQTRVTYAVFEPGQAGEPAQPPTYQLSNSNPALFSVAPAIATNRTLTFTPATNANGTALVTVIVRADGADVATNTFAIVVTAVNDVPVVTLASNVTVLEDVGAQGLGGFAAFTAGPADESTQAPTHTLTADYPALFSVQPAIAANGTLSFTPATNANGTATVTVVTVDGGGTANTGGDRTTNTFTLTVTAVNDAPAVAYVTNNVVVLEDAGAQSVSGFATFTAGPADESTQTPAYTLTVDNGALFSAQPAIGANGALTFKPALNANGSAIVTVITADSGGTSGGGVDRSTNTFTITVTLVNDAPAVAYVTNNVVVLEDAGAQSVSGFATFSAGPADESSQTPAYTLTANNASLFNVQPALAANGTLTFTPTANANGSATVTVITADSGGTANNGADRSTNSFTITVTAVNDSPSVSYAMGIVTVLEDAGARTVSSFATFTAGPPDESAQTAAYTLTADNAALFSVQPAIAANGALTFTPAANANGSATVTVVLQDSGGTSGGGVDKATNTFSIAVTAVNDPPSVAFATNNVIAVKDTGAQTAAGFATFTAGPADESAQTPAYTLSSDNAALFSVQPAIAPNGTLTFTPAAGTEGVAMVTVVVQDNGGMANGGGDKATNTFAITVVPFSTAPDSYSVSEDRLLTVIASAGVLTNDVGVGLGVRLVDAATNGMVTLNANGSFTYLLATNFHGTDTFTYQATNSLVASAPTAVTITVSSVNDAPSVAYSTNEVVVLEDAGAQSFAGFASFTAGPTNESAQTLVGYTVSNSSNALFSVQPAIDGTGQLTFTPATNANGAATVTVIVQDSGGTGDSGVDKATNTFVITVTPVNDQPTAALAGNVTVLEDAGPQTRSGFVTSFVPGPVDESGQAPTYQVTSDNALLFSVQPAIASDGTLTFTPATNANGAATVTVIVQDSGGTGYSGVDKTTNTFTVTVAPVNDAPSFAFSTNFFTRTVAWGSNINGTTNVPVGLNAVLGFAAGGEHILAVRRDGTVAAWGLNDAGQTSVPAALARVTAVAAGERHSLALKSDGTVVGWGLNNRFQTSVPVGLSEVTAISAGGNHSLALKSNGTVVAWGQNTYSESIVPAGLTGVSAIAAGYHHSVALRTDGTVVVWGYGGNGERDVPAGLTNVAAIAAGYYHVLALKNDGTVVAWGYNTVGQATVPAGLSGVRAVTAGFGHSIALKDDGTVVAWGINNFGQTDVPAGLGGVTKVVAGGVHAVALASAETASVNVLEDNGAFSAGDFVVGITAGPANEASQVVGFTVTSDNTSLFSTQPAVAADGTLTFTPAADANGTATVTIVAQDDGGTVNGGVDKRTNTFSIVVTSVNDVPVVTFAQATVALLEDAGAQTLNAFATFSPGPANESAQTLVAYTVSNSSNALFSVPPVIDNDGRLTFTPATNANGSVMVKVIAQDNGGVDRSTNTFTIIVLPVNDPPSIPLEGELVFPEDSDARIVVPLTESLRGPANESAQAFLSQTTSNSNNALFNSQPRFEEGALYLVIAPNANGSALVTVVSQDSGGTANGGIDRATNTFTITVTPVNDAPSVSFAQATVAVLEDAGAQSMSSFVTYSPGPANESAQALVGYTVTVDNAAVFSAAPTIANNGMLNFTTATNASGSATVTVVVQDNGGTAGGGVDKSTNTFTIAVTAVNDTPVANADSYTMSQGNVLTVAAAGVLANDTDVENNPLTATKLTNPTHGTITFNANGGFTYSPDQSFYGVDSFTYRASDASSNSTPATVSLIVLARPVITPPPGKQRVFSSAALRFSATNAPDLNAIRVSDPDSTALTLTLTVTNGTLAVTVTNGLALPNGSTSTNTLVMAGAIASLNAALESLAYVSTTNYFGDDALVLVAQDEGGRTNRGNSVFDIQVEIPARGASLEVPLNGFNNPGVGRMVTNATVVTLDTNLVEGITYDPTNNVVRVLPVAGQDGSTNRSTVTVLARYSDGTTELVTVPVIIYQPLLTSATNQGSYNSTFGTPLFNPQTSLYEQKVSVVNNTPFDFTALRLTATNLPATVTLQNATLTNAGRVYLDYNLTIPAGSNVTLKVEYFSSDLQPFSPGLKLELLNQQRASTVPTNALMTAVAASRNGYDPDRVAKNYLKFPTRVGQPYYVQYQDVAGPVWKTSPVVINGTGRIYNWIDDGPPGTDTAPGPARFYRVVTDR
ncbi:MAG: tandem-95 repeat protein [Limisphaerales bacterium]